MSFSYANWEKPLRIHHPGAGVLRSTGSMTPKSRDRCRVLCLAFFQTGKVFETTSKWQVLNQVPLDQVAFWEGNVQVKGTCNSVHSWRPADVLSEELLHEWILQIGCLSVFLSVWSPQSSLYFVCEWLIQPETTVVYRDVHYHQVSPVTSKKYIL